MSRSANVLLAGSLLCALTLPASAANIFCTVTGAKQGVFAGDSNRRGSQIEVFALTEEVKSPRDPTTGQVSGKRQHQPLIIVKELDRSSPQFFAAAVENETLKSVSCTMYRNGADGASHAYYKVVLTNATIVDLRDSGDGANGAAQGDERERISFVFQKIELTDLDSGTVAQDDWESPVG